MNTTVGLLVVRSAAQRQLMTGELFGQISDGFWENSSGTSWETWCSCKVVVGENVGRSFFVSKANFNFTHPDLLKAVGARMVTDVRDVCNLPDYSIKDLKADLTDLKAIIKTMTTLTEEQAAELGAIRAKETRAAADAQAERAYVAARINELGKELNFSVYASEYNTRVEVSQRALLELLGEVKASRISEQL